MADDPKKQLLPLLALTVLIGLAYAGLTLFGTPAPEADGGASTAQGTRAPAGGNGPSAEARAAPSGLARKAGVNQRCMASSATAAMPCGP